MREQSNNKVTVAGTIAEKQVFDHVVCGECFYHIKLNVVRKSGCIDQIPLMVSERLVDVTEDLTGAVLKVSGQFRSFNKYDGERNKLLLFVFAQEAEFLDEAVPTNNNYVFLEGSICREPNYRVTSRGRQICDLLVAVNRPNGRSDYIPCISWGRNAEFSAGFSIGTRVRLYGRLQSREYTKMLDATTGVTRTAYECSVNRIECVQDK